MNLQINTSNILQLWKTARTTIQKLRNIYFYSAFKTMDWPHIPFLLIIHLSKVLPWKLKSKTPQLNITTHDIDKVQKGLKIDKSARTRYNTLQNSNRWHRYKSSTVVITIWLTVTKYPNLKGPWMFSFLYHCHYYYRTWLYIWVTRRVL